MTCRKRGVHLIVPVLAPALEPGEGEVIEKQTQAPEPVIRHVVELEDEAYRVCYLLGGDRDPVDVAELRDVCDVLSIVPSHRPLVQAKLARNLRDVAPRVKLEFLDD